MIFSPSKGGSVHDGDRANGRSSGGSLLERLSDIGMSPSGGERLRSSGGSLLERLSDISWSCDL